MQKNFGYLLLYVSMFPQLIAGPIVKYVDIEAQIRKRTLHGKEVGEGVLRFLVGLFKKAVLANVAGEVAAQQGKATGVMAGRALAAGTFGPET